MTRTGFIYIWFDRLRRKYYIGSHYGDKSDGYIGSGTYFMRAYAKRPYDFCRRILETVHNRNDLLKAEQRWLNMIKDEELGKRYYNLKKVAKGGSPKGKRKPLSEETKQKLRKPKRSKENYYGSKSDVHRKNISDALKKSQNVNNSGPNNPRYSGVSNEEFREKYICYCLLLGYQPGILKFSNWFLEQTGKHFPRALSKHRFNKGKDLFEEIEKTYGLVRKSRR